MAGVKDSMCLLHVEVEMKINKALSLQNYVSGIKHKATSFIILMNNLYNPVTTHFLKLFSVMLPLSNTHMRTSVSLLRL